MPQARTTLRPRARHLSSIARIVPLAALLSLGACSHLRGGDGDMRHGAGMRGADSSMMSQSRTAEDERDAMEDLAQANLAEIATGRLALEKSRDPAVRRFAQQMIDDHTKALNELRGIAQKKNVRLPTEPDFAHQAMATALRATTGDFFDKQYAQHAGVGDHRRTVDLLQNVRRDSSDPELRAYAGKTLQTVQQHLTMARQLNRSQ